MHIVSFLFINYSETVFRHLLQVALRWCLFACSCLSIQAGLVDYVFKDTHYGRLRGQSEEIFPRHPVDIFLGIPYAQPPIGQLRFEPPAPPERWEGILNATDMPAACPQLNSDFSYISAHVPGFNRTDEDCLYLNIYAPYLRRNAASMPVMVYIHGGSNEHGMAGMFNGTVLASWADIVVVTVNYRLGPLGFLSLGDDVMPGNYGLLDQLAALKWVKNNIHSFGGDPDRVTLAGHSSGSCDVSLHMVSPLAKGLFRAVIAQSGSPTAAWAMMKPPLKPAPFSRKMGASIGCSYIESALFKECLQNKSVEEIINANIERPNALFKYYPVIDKHYMPAIPENLMETGRLNAWGYLTGVTSDEGSLTAQGVLDYYGTENITPEYLRNVLRDNIHNFPNISGILENIFLAVNWVIIVNHFKSWLVGVLRRTQDYFTYMAALPGLVVEETGHLKDLLMYEYTNWQNITDSNVTLHLMSKLFGDGGYEAPMVHTADILSRKNVSVYVYKFEHRSHKHPLSPWLGVPHGDDLFYVFGSPVIGNPLYNYTEEDRRISEMIMTAWGNFVRHGVPGAGSKSNKKATFPKYEYPTKKYTRLISDKGVGKTVTGSNMRSRKMAFWNKLLPNLKYGAVGRPSPWMTSRIHGLDFELLTWILVAVSVALLVLIFIVTLYVMRLKGKLSKVSKPITSNEQS